jgi:hypothetical protein
MNPCTTCLHSTPARGYRGGEYAYCCTHPSIARVSPVTGQPLMPNCALIRSEMNDTCGPEGKLYEPKP